MSNLTDFFPSGGGGGLTPKFEEFNSSGTFTPSQALIDAGGYIELFLVAGGARGPGGSVGGPGGEVLMKKMYLTSVSGVSVSIGANASDNNVNGGNSSFAGSSAGGIDVTAEGGDGGGFQSYKLGAGFTGNSSGTGVGSGNGVFGYGAGGANGSAYGGIYRGKANSGQGGYFNQTAGSGYCLIKWYE